MSQNIICWDITDTTIETETKYCSGCKKKVVFTDTLVRRHNANGKRIFQFAIYKCDNGHTWNKVLDKYAASCAEKRSDYLSREDNPYNRIKPGVKLKEKMMLEETMVIKITSLKGRQRLDRLIAENLSGVSRSCVQKWIETGVITVNDDQVKKQYQTKNSDIIKIESRIR